MASKNPNQGDAMFRKILCVLLASGCATTHDHTRHEGARSGALQGAGYSVQFGGEMAKEDPGAGLLFTLVTFPVFALVGAATGALSARK